MRGRSYVAIDVNDYYTVYTKDDELSVSPQSRVSLHLMRRKNTKRLLQIDNSRDERLFHN